LDLSFNFQTYQLCYGPRLILGSDVAGRYIPDIETNIAFVLNWYYLKYLPGRYHYKAGIASGHTSLVDSLIPAPVYIPGFQLQGHPCM
jgi:hypothetical protein